MFALTLALAVLVGITLGLLGGGGSILMVPLLVYVAGMEAKEAIATSLLVVGVTSAAGAISHARAGRVQWCTGATFGAGGMAGAYIGGRLAAFVPGGAPGGVRGDDGGHGDRGKVPPSVLRRTFG